MDLDLSMQSSFQSNICANSSLVTYNFDLEPNANEDLIIELNQLPIPTDPREPQLQQLLLPTAPLIDTDGSSVSPSRDLLIDVAETETKKLEDTPSGIKDSLIRTIRPETPDLEWGTPGTVTSSVVSKHPSEESKIQLHLRAYLYTR